MLYIKFLCWYESSKCCHFCQTIAGSGVFLLFIYIILKFKALQSFVEEEESWFLQIDVFHK